MSSELRRGSSSGLKSRMSSCIWAAGAIIAGAPPRPPATAAGPDEGAGPETEEREAPLGTNAGADTAGTCEEENEGAEGRNSGMGFEGWNEGVKAGTLGLNSCPGTKVGLWEGYD